MPIHVLSSEVATQIAAGEVVERPASVVKEAVENSIDADAGDIRVDIRAGGKEYIVVVDDGQGIPADEVELAFQRHSTSKLQRAEDLDHITTLGFRGEALAAISAVSRLTFVTRAVDENVGTRLHIEGGRRMSRENVGRPPGTTLQVEGLFYNVPARRKFLRTDYTEQRHVDAWLTRYAMAYPNLRFTLSHSDNVVFQAPGSGELRDVLVAVHGVEIGEQMLDVQTVEGRESSQENSIRVRGLVSPPSLHRANRTYITFFVNGRWVQDRSLTYAIIQAYHTLLPKGRYPLGVVMVSLPPSEVDVNVHPAKSEVRFRDGDAVFRAVQKAVRRTLIQQSPVPVSRPPATAWTGGQGGQWDANRRERFASLESAGAGPRPRKAEATSSGLGGMTSAGGEDLPPLRLLGQLRTTYVVAEGPNGLILVDQHAAHERVLFDRLMASRQAGEVTSQALLKPSLVELPPEAAAIIEEHLESIVALGFQLEPFGSGSFLLRAVPAEVADTMGDPASLLDEVATACLAGDTPLADRVEERVAREVCKQAAIKAGQVMSRDEMAELLRALERSRSPRTCPHGRPTIIQISVSHLANEFGR